MLIVVLIAMLIYGVALSLLPNERHDEMAVWVLILAIGLANWVHFARTVRGSTLVEKNKEYVQSARRRTADETIAGNADSHRPGFPVCR